MNAARIEIENAPSPAGMSLKEVETPKTTNAKVKVWLVNDNDSFTVNARIYQQNKAGVCR